MILGLYLEGLERASSMLMFRRSLLLSIDGFIPTLRAHSAMHLVSPL